MISPEFAVFFGITLSSLGIYFLWAGTNPWAAILTLATLAIYLLLYTPMKKRSPYATEIGNLWCITPLIGWVAAEGAHHLWLDFIWYFCSLGSSLTLWPLLGISAKTTPRVDSNCTNLEIRTVNPLHEKVLFTRCS